MFLRSILTDLSIPPSGPTPVYDHVLRSSIHTMLQTTLNTLILHTSKFKSGKRRRWNYQSFGCPYKTSNKGSTFPSHWPHHGTLPLIYFTYYILFFIWLVHILSLFVYWWSGRDLYYVQVIHTIHTYIVYWYPVRVPISSYIILSSSCSIFILFGLYIYT